MRRQHDLGMGPEPAVGRQRLGGVDVDRHGAERAVIEACQNISFILQPAAPGIDQYRRAQRETVAGVCFSSRCLVGARSVGEGPEHGACKPIHRPIDCGRS